MQLQQHIGPSQAPRGKLAVVVDGAAVGADFGGYKERRQCDAQLLLI
jgi:hypothetical protein